MKNYHGSHVVVNNPVILKSNGLLDFGIGFYTTSNKEQVVHWAKKVSVRNNTGNQYLSVYNFNIKKLEQWLEFITANRRGYDITNKYDIVIGPAADDNAKTY